MSNKKLHFETLQLHVGQENPDPATDARAVPIYQTTSYVFRNSQHAADRFGLRDAGNIYGRLTNSTQGVFEDRVAALEGGVAGLAVASGAAAVTYALQNILQAGDHIVAADNLYGGSFNLITHTLTTQGISNTIVNVNDLEALEAAIQPNTKVVYAETFGNPNSDVTNLEAVAAVAHRHNIPFIVDNTFGTPYIIRPIEHGADVVVHSATKFIGGHGSSLGGVIVDGGTFDWKANADKYPTLAKPDPSYHGAIFADVAGKAAFVTRIRAAARHGRYHIAVQRMDTAAGTRNSVAARRASRGECAQGGEVSGIQPEGGEGEPSVAAYSSRPRAVREVLPQRRRFDIHI